MKKKLAFTLAEVENSDGLKIRHYEEQCDEVIQKNGLPLICRANSRNDRVHAFTLAEVLITLGIIGVVAAMTIPTLMQKTNDAEIVSGVLKANSVLSNAAKEVEAVEGVKLKDLTEESFKSYFVSHLNTLGSCDDYDLCLADGSGMNYPNFYEGCSEDLTSEGSASSLKESCAKVDIDVNGKKGPNKYGHDQYSFALTRNGVVPLGQQGSCSGADCTNYVLFNRKLSTTIANNTGAMEKSADNNIIPVLFESCDQVGLCINGLRCVQGKGFKNWVMEPNGKCD